MTQPGPASAAASLAGLALRPARSSDTLCLSVLATQVFLDTYALEGIRPALAREVLSTYAQSRFEEALACGHSRLAVAERQGHLVGFAQVTLGARHTLAPADMPAELLRLYVQEPFTGRGVGTRLLREAERLAAAAGADLMWLTPWVHNTRARAFYESRGYADQGLTHFVFEGESHENRVMARRLDDLAGAAGAAAADMAVLRRFFAAINRNDMEAVALDFDPDIVRVEPAGFPSAGTYRGTAAVQAHVRQGRGTWAEGRCDPEGLFARDGKVVVFLHAHVRLHGSSDWVGGRFADGFVLRNGRITEYRSFAARDEALAWAGIEPEPVHRP